jgi:hypothetical protein
MGFNWVLVAAAPVCRPTAPHTTGNNSCSHRITYMLMLSASTLN